MRLTLPQIASEYDWRKLHVVFLLDSSKPEEVAQALAEDFGSSDDRYTMTSENFFIGVWGMSRLLTEVIFKRLFDLPPTFQGSHDAMRSVLAKFCEEATGKLNLMSKSVRVLVYHTLIVCS